VDTASFVGTKRETRQAAGGRVKEQGGTGGKRVSGLRSKPPVLRVVVAVLVVGFGALGFTGLLSSPSAEPTVQAFLLDWQQRSFTAAASLTTGDPAQVAADLKDAYQGLDAAAYYLSMGAISQSGHTALASFSASVDLGQDGAPWVYTGRFTLRQDGSGWKIVWSPSVISPGLRPGLHLALVSSAPDRKPLLDDQGRPLQVPSAAYVAGVEPDKLREPAATASALGAATGLEPTELLGRILAAPRASFQELVVFRPQQYQRLRQRLAKVPGLIVRPEKPRLFTSIAPAVVGSVGTEISRELRDMGIAYRPGATVGLAGLQQAYQSKLAGTPTTMVITENAAGQQKSVLKTWQGRTPTAVRTTLDFGAQTAANQAVASAAGPAAVVAVQASTGHILAVAQHAPHGLTPLSPLEGHYQPGTAFTIVSTSALLASGLGVGTPVRCTDVNDVGGRNFHNVPAVPNLGNQPTFAVDFAHACGTAFSGLSEGITARELNTAAGAFGLRANWDLPLPSFSGQVQAGGGFAQVASDTIGQGSVQVSPLAMALVAAEVDSGSWHRPSLVTLPHDPPVTRPAKLGESDLNTLRTLMRGTVRSGVGTGANLAGQPVYGQVGTAAYGTGKHHKWVSWFVGYRGDVAFAVLQVTPTASTPSVPLAARFLAGVPAG
jgi:cell division protein FtsI/penicillin-binding protein 2